MRNLEETFEYDNQNRLKRVRLGPTLTGASVNDSYDHQRIFMDEHVGNRHRTYLTGPTGVYAVVATENGREKIHYIMKDNLGSWTTITDEEGSVEQYLNYDAWGNLRNPNYWTGFFSSVPMFDRGFTGHEHLPAFGLINMNGRMYDPVMSSFLSVDQYVQSPENAQGFNRYAYCMNNPLRYTDPSGWRCIGGIVGYTPNSATNDPYAYVDNRYLEPRDLGIRELSTSDPIITWMEENSLNGGGGGGSAVTKGGWYKSNGEICWNPEINSQNDLDKFGINGIFLGQRFVDETSQTYYSLLGYKVDMKESNGLAGELFSLIDIALCKFENDKLTNNKDLFDPTINEPSTSNFGIIEYIPNGDNLYSFKTNGFIVYLQVFDDSSGKRENSMNAVFCGLSSSNKYNSNNNFKLSQHTTLVPGYDLYFNNPYANPKCWRVMIVFPTISVRNNFINRYHNTFGHGKY